MIGSVVGGMLLESQEAFLIPAKNAANVMCHRPLSHDLLILSKVGYSKIPILRRDDHFVGLVSLSDVVNKMIDSQAISMDPLEGLTVVNVTETDISTVNEDWELEEVLHSLVDSPFSPVVTEERVFKKIITGRELLKAMDFMVHELERHNILSPKIKELKKQIDIVS